jgi:hypothetical protein
MQESASTVAGVQGAAENDPTARLQGVLDEAQYKLSPGFHALMDALAWFGDARVQAGMLQHGPEVSKARAWLEPLRDALNGVFAGIQFAESPSRKTLQDVLVRLHGGMVEHADLEPELVAFEQHLSAHEAQHPRPSMDAVLGAALGDHGQHYKQTVAAVVHEHATQDMAEIGRRVGLSRSQVYAGVRRFRQLPAPMRAAIRRSLRGTIVKYSGDEVLPVNDHISFYD